MIGCRNDYHAVIGCTNDYYAVIGCRNDYYAVIGCRNDYYYEEEYEDGYDERQRYSSRGRGRGRGGQSSSRGRFNESRGSTRSGKDEGADKGPTIDQWNGPPAEDGGKKSDWDKEYMPPSAGRGRGEFGC